MNGNAAWAAIQALLTLVNVANTALLLSVHSPWAAFAAGAAVYTGWVTTVFARKAIR